MNTKLFYTLNLIAYTGIGACNGATVSKMDKKTVTLAQESDKGSSYMSNVSNNKNVTITREMITKYEKEADELDKESEDMKKKIRDRMGKDNKEKTASFPCDNYKVSGNYIDKFITVTEEIIIKYEKEADELDKESEDMKKKIRDRIGKDNK
ncbi:MAG: hypothetical protein NMK33_06410 (plasmid) [Candidatus Cardinium sp.]|uniref:hypothetical protein n=1 Tax=Cardinium endosymbiont of Dermatophagoides farinae TaxID=2597823 RepID=UPI001183A498|nr:hypothetical protein [Cardinium endosymbiont of Dermatophagoides farinae]TSJ80179.1 hypothetical protein FPG78_06175 [Cardinium endosymbiont of Dermatophagoides farinae]UWW97552.1 MAG: hypothetical protein NMK33_06410 [Candidatus Cardinium sp.]